MKKLLSLAAALAFGLSLMATTGQTANANGTFDQFDAIVAEISHLEQDLTLAVMAGDYRFADMLNAKIKDLELLLQMAKGSSKIANGDLGSGRIANGDLGSGRISSGDMGSGRIANGDLGSGR